MKTISSITRLLFARSPKLALGTFRSMLPCEQSSSPRSCITLVILHAPICAYAVPYLHARQRDNVQRHGTQTHYIPFQNPSFRLIFLIQSIAPEYSRSPPPIPTTWSFLRTTSNGCVNSRAIPPASPPDSNFRPTRSKSLAGE